MTLRRNGETILILQENDEIIAAIQKTIATTGNGFELKVWRNATSQCAGCEEYFHSAALISLDHDLIPARRAQLDRGTGLGAARFRACAEWFVHSTDANRAYSMHHKLRIAD